MTELRKVDQRIERGRRSRRLLLERAIDIASVEGMESISIRRLAAELNVSKSGVFAQFGSKEELQLAVVRAAVEVFVSEVVKPALKAPAGIRRVWALCEAWLQYVMEPVFSGGCFFVAVAAEFDSRPGRVRDAIAAGRRDWQKLYETTIGEARGLGEIVPGTDPAQLAFELDALARAGAEDALLLDDPTAFDRAHTALRDRLRAVAVDPELVP